MSCARCPSPYITCSVGDLSLSTALSLMTFIDLACLTTNLHNSDKSDICSTDSWPTAIFAVLPFVFRFGQCCRRLFNEPQRTLQVVNAVKYALSVVYQLFYYHWRIHQSPSDHRKVVFVILAVANSLASVAWDVAVDWSLLQPNRKHYLLRAKLGLFNKPWIYYASAAAGLPLRFAWCVYLTATSKKIAGFSNASLEIVRRAIWNVSRCPCYAQRIADIHSDDSCGVRRCRKVSAASQRTARA